MDVHRRTMKVGRAKNDTEILLPRLFAYQESLSYHLNLSSLHVGHLFSQTRYENRQSFDYFLSSGSDSGLYAGLVGL